MCTHFWMSEWVRERGRDIQHRAAYNNRRRLLFNGTEKKNLSYITPRTCFCSLENHCWESNYNIVVIGIFLLQQQLPTMESASERIKRKKERIGQNWNLWCEALIMKQTLRRRWWWWWWSVCVAFRSSCDTLWNFSFSWNAFKWIFKCAYSWLCCRLPYMPFCHRPSHYSWLQHAKVI